MKTQSQYDCVKLSDKVSLEVCIYKYIYINIYMK